jgi:hypothetical protein
MVGTSGGSDLQIFKGVYEEKHLFNPWLQALSLPFLFFIQDKIETCKNECVQRNISTHL